MVERNLARGVITAKEVEEATKKLPDDAENADYVSLSTLAADQSDTGSSNGRSFNH